MKKDFEALKAEPKDFKRKTRSEQEAARNQAVDALIEEEEVKVDVYDLSAPQEILG